MLGPQDGCFGLFQKNGDRSFAFGWEGRQLTGALSMTSGRTMVKVLAGIECAAQSYLQGRTMTTQPTESTSNLLMEANRSGLRLFINTEEGGSKLKLLLSRGPCLEACSKTAPLSHFVGLLFCTFVQELLWPSKSCLRECKSIRRKQWEAIELARHHGNRERWVNDIY